MLAFMRCRSESASCPIQRYCSTASTTSAPPRAINESSAATALRLDAMQSSLASANLAELTANARFTFLTNALRSLDHFTARAAYIAHRKEQGPNETPQHHHRPRRCLHHARRFNRG